MLKTTQQNMKQQVLPKKMKHKLEKVNIIQLQRKKKKSKTNSNHLTET